MKIVILCGGKGTRLNSSLEDVPKPLASVKGRPIIWHIMKLYLKYGYNEFILPLGFGGDKIKEYFMSYEWKTHDFLKDSQAEQIKLFEESENWKISFIETGIDTMTGSRLKKIEKYITDDTFMVTYGDGLSDVNIHDLLLYHEKMGKLATVTGVDRKSQYGVLNVEKGIATSFNEKSNLDGIINGGYFVLNKGIFKYIDDASNCVFEEEPLKKLAFQRELAVYKHDGFWMSIDTQKDLSTANLKWGENNV